MYLSLWRMFSLKKLRVKYGELTPKELEIVRFMTLIWYHEV